MTWLECTRCKRHWRIHTLHPELFKGISRLCPGCVTRLPIMEEDEW